MYATVADMRNEGVTVAQASDERLTSLLEEATYTIDRVTGWFFEPREQRYLLDGRDTPSIEPPVPPIRIDSLMVGEDDIAVDEDNVVIVGAPVAPGFYAPRITLRNRTFTKGTGNVAIEGLWGYTEDDGTDVGRTPLEIRRVCMMLALRWISPLASDDGEARNRWRIIEERTRDQSYKLDRVTATGALTGDPEIDSILARYRRPAGLGAV